MTTSNIILVLTAICSALMAGLFYSYSCSVVLGLASLPDAEYIAVMQSINKAIQNPVFFIAFFGILILLPVSTFLNYGHPVPVRFWLLLTAAVIYLSGAFGITVFGNIPLNNALEKFDLINATKENIHLQRTAFETRWSNLNIVRTISSIFSLVLIIIACVYPGKSQPGISD